MSFVLAAMAGAVIIDATFTRSFLDPSDVDSTYIDAPTTYLTWSALSVGIVLLNALVPVIASELRGLFSTPNANEPPADSLDGSLPSGATARD